MAPVLYIPEAFFQSRLCYNYLPTRVKPCFIAFILATRLPQKRVCMLDNLLGSLFMMLDEVIRLAKINVHGLQGHAYSQTILADSVHDKIGLKISYTYCNRGRAYRSSHFFVTASMIAKACFNAHRPHFEHCKQLSQTTSRMSLNIDHIGIQIIIKDHHSLPMKLRLLWNLMLNNVNKAPRHVFWISQQR